MMMPSWYAPPADTGALEKLFRYEVLKMLKADGKITDDVVPALIESEVSSKEFRKSWAHLIQKIYHATKPASVIWMVIGPFN